MNGFMNCRSAQRGFTLTEMLATLAVTAITATMAVPAMRNLIVDNERTSGANELISMMHAARSTAITRNVQVTVCPSSDARHCNKGKWQDGWIYFIDNDQDRRVDANEEILGSMRGMKDITIRSQDFKQFLVFRPNGYIMVNTTAENSGELLLCDARGTDLNRSLILHVGGKPQLTINKTPGAYAACRAT